MLLYEPYKTYLMKKSFYFVFLILPLFFMVACSNTNSTTTDKDTSSIITTRHEDTSAAAAPTVYTDSAESQSKASPAITADDQPVSYGDSVDFKKYLVKLLPGPKADIDWNSNANAKTFKTRISDSYTGRVNFAGHYIGTVFGCGAGCVLGFMVDTRDGKIYNLPLGEENMCVNMQDAALFRDFSRLFVSAVCKENPEDQKVFYKAYLWDEENKRFERLKDRS